MLMNTVPVLGTKKLFDRLLKLFKPGLVCDIGSMDASDALRFRKILPQSRILAFEANPLNVSRMEKDKRLTSAYIELIPQAVWNSEGLVSFFVEKLGQNNTGEDIRQGISSIRLREGDSLGWTKVVVPSVRLDNFVGRMEPLPASVALWIDVEGCGFEVLEGTEGIMETVQLIHIEVETRPFWIGQKLAPEVVKWAQRHDFQILARGRNEEQYDLVLIKNTLYTNASRRIDARVFLTRLLTERFRVFGG